VGPAQRPKLWALYQEVLDTMDWPEVPELYVTQTPLVNAAAVGFDKPFIVMNSGLLELLDTEEQREILGHELGHIMSGHTTYTTIAIILMTIGFQNLPFLAGIAILPFQLALMEWYRKAELSSDRAGLLATQEPMTSMSTFLKMAGGRKYEDEISVEEFQNRRATTRPGQRGRSRLAGHQHGVPHAPFGTVRAAELQRWIDSGEYAKIVGGTIAVATMPPHRRCRRTSKTRPATMAIRRRRRWRRSRLGRARRVRRRLQDLSEEK
jgi:Zn-dependent protease with chaperone function